MFGEVVTDHLADDLRRRQVLSGAKLFERLLLVRIDEERQAGGLCFHLKAVA